MRFLSLSRSNYVHKHDGVHDWGPRSVISILKKFCFNLIPFFPIIAFQFLIFISQKIPILIQIPFFDCNSISILNSISSNNFCFYSHFNSNSLCPSCSNTSYTTSEYMLVRKCHCYSSSAHISIQLQECTHL